MVEVKADDSGEPGASKHTIEYDGLNRRIVVDGSTRYDYYYNTSWQLLERRRDQGEYPKVAWALARHSTICSTTARCRHTQDSEQFAALDILPTVRREKARPGTG
jgi:hypothetical protein